MKRSLEDTLLTQVNTARDKVLSKLFKEFTESGEKDHREEIYAKVDVLNDVIYRLKSEIRKFDK